MTEASPLINAEKPKTYLGFRIFVACVLLISSFYTLLLQLCDLPYYGSTRPLTCIVEVSLSKYLLIPNFILFILVLGLSSRKFARAVLLYIVLFWLAYAAFILVENSRTKSIGEQYKNEEIAAYSEAIATYFNLENNPITTECYNNGSVEKVLSTDNPEIASLGDFWRFPFKCDEANIKGYYYLNETLDDETVTKKLIERGKPWIPQRAGIEASEFDDSYFKSRVYTFPPIYYRNGISYIYQGGIIKEVYNEKTGEWQDFRQYFNSKSSIK